MDPPCSATMACTIVSPRPVPWMACSVAVADRKKRLKKLRLLGLRNALTGVGDDQGRAELVDAEAQLDPDHRPE